MDKLMQHQDKALNFLSGLPGVGALFLPMGLGKTRIILEHILRMKYNKTIIVTKKSILRTLSSEVCKWTNLSWEVVSSSKKEYDLTKQVVLINYDMVFNRKKQLIKYQADAIILDESHCIKTPSALRTKAIFEVRDGVIKESSNTYKSIPIAYGNPIGHRYILTGTSMTKGFEDWYTQFKFLSNEIMPKYITNYRAMYCPMGMFPKRYGGMFPKMLGYMNITSSHNPAIVPLIERVKPFVFSAKKEECIDLPSKTFTVEEIEMSLEQKKIYKQMRDESITYLESKEFVASVYLTRILKLQQIANGFLISEDGTYHRLPGMNGKIEWLEENIHNIIQEHKLVIWTHFTESSNIVKDFLNKRGILYAYLHRSMDENERQLQVDKFQSDDKVRVFTSSSTIGGYGITLTRADYALFFDNSYNFVDREQAQDRIHRIGQTRSCHYIDLLTANSVERSILENLSGKRSLHELSTNELRNIIRRND
jgi:SNF2 family DNA or RNA helicase